MLEGMKFLNGAGTAALFALTFGASACSTVLGTFSNEGTGGGGGAATAGPATGSTGTTSGCDACSPNASCIENLCVCNDGFEGSGASCDDIDECAKMPGTCGANATCFNRIGGFDCKCNEGFVATSKGCAPAFTEVATIPNVAFDGFGGRVVGTPTKIYIGNESQADPFLFSYVVADNSTQKEPETPQQSLCACGYRAALVNVDEQVFAFGNEGHRLLNGTWSAVTGYVSPFRRGEAAAFLLNGTIFLLGGRADGFNEDQASSSSFSPSLNKMAGPGVLPDYVWGPVSEAAAVVVGNDAYVMGGFTKANGNNRAAVLRSATKTWEKLPEVPNPGNKVSIAARNGDVFFASATTLARFDTKTLTWDNRLLEFPKAGKFWNIAGTGKDVFAVGEINSAIHILRLNDIPE